MEFGQQLSALFVLAISLGWITPLSDELSEWPQLWPGVLMLLLAGGTYLFGGQFAKYWTVLAALLQLALAKPFYAGYDAIRWPALFIGHKTASGSRTCRRISRPVSFCRAPADAVAGARQHEELKA